MNKEIMVEAAAGSKIWQVSDIQLRKFGMKTVPQDFAIPDGD
ncbi:hypothetical protein WN51_06320 [Melipona quadrifasciata]|uniref:Uncharacterized protein n=1 Tax=Melipona quadrifasciata TaxID=166423 RepID=A0A0M8ZR01_9HYME|nr:hypothetical protein WN51_06320 [Melipona quadrifasciata]